MTRPKPKWTWKETVTVVVLAGMLVSVGFGAGFTLADRTTAVVDEKLTYAEQLIASYRESLVECYMQQPRDPQQQAPWVEAHR